MTLPQLLETAAERHGDRPFLLAEDRVLSYAEFFACANDLACHWAERGIGRGDRVAVVLPNGPEIVLAWFALGRLGAVLVPLNPALPPSAVEPLLRDVEARALVGDAAHLAAHAAIPWRLKVRVGAGEAPGAIPFGAPKAATTRPCGARAEDLAAILQTSGTTGRAKGAGLSHRGYTWPAREFVRWMRAVPEDRFLGCLPLFHLAGQSFLASAVEAGAALALVPRFSAQRFWEEVRAQAITLVRHLGEMLAVLCRQPESPLDRQHTLRAVYGGGARADVAERFERRFGAAVVEGYGLTETNTVLRNELGRRRRSSIGRPLPYGEVRIADPAGRPLPPSRPGEAPYVGEIQVRKNPVMMTGYLGGSDLTAACFAGDWFRTGDLGYRDADGYFYFVGREKDSIRRRGETIQSAKVERFLDRYPGVAAAAVVGVPDEVGGEEVKAFLVCRPGCGLDALEPLDLDALVEWCRAQLADFEIPRFFELCAELPPTATEKVDKGHLRRAGTTGGPCYDRRERTWRAAATIAVPPAAGLPAEPSADGLPAASP